MIRTECEKQCNLGAVLEVNVQNPVRPIAAFKRMRHIPGLGISRPAFLYDEESGLYWMVSNLQRQAWSGKDQHPGCDCINGLSLSRYVPIA
jgi:hypothetical protein